jgi:hypothetical protein
MSLTTKIFFPLMLLGAFTFGQKSESSTLKARNPKADPTKYQQVRDAVDWKNPCIVVHADGVVIIGVTPPGKHRPVSDVRQTLENLPSAAWPYGLVVAIQETGPRPFPNPPAIESNYRLLVRTLKAMGIAVNEWPSA